MYRFWERLFVPFGAYRKHYDEDLEPVFEDDEIFVLGINSAHNWTIKDGRVSGRRIRQVERRLGAVPAAKLRIAVVHHEVIPAPRFGSQKVLSNGERLVAALHRCGVRLVLSGHLHQAYCELAESYYPGVGSMVVAHSGTTTSSRGRGCEVGRNTGHWIEIDAGALRVHRLEWDPAAAAFTQRALHQYPSPAPAGGS
jgi:3',5'-cyclic AMP phosphodiesterase CpdA